MKQKVLLNCKNSKAVKRTTYSNVPVIPNSPKWIRNRQVQYSQIYLYGLAVAACKAAFLCWYLDLAPRRQHRKTFWIGIFPACILVTAMVIYLILHGTLICRPINHFWDARYTCPRNAPLVMTALAGHLVTNIQGKADNLTDYTKS